MDLKRKKSIALCLLLAVLAVFASPFVARAEASTKFIPSDNSIGTWDPVARVYTLFTDVYETIQVEANDLIVDGAGYSVIGEGTSSGVYLYGRTAVTVRNLNVEGFSFGIYVHDSSGNILEHNTANSNSRYGIYLNNSNGNTITNNSVADNHEGIFLHGSSSNSLVANLARDNYSGISLHDNCNNNILTDNTANDNSHGIYLYNSRENELADNTTNSNNYYGIYLHYNCNSNTLINNTASWNHSHGIYLNNSSSNALIYNTASYNYPGIYFYDNSNNNVLTDNTISNNYYGIYLNYNCNSNEVYHNNFINNQTQVYIYSCSGNIFSVSIPVGGNYWSNWTSPNIDGDVFVDDPYVFSSGQDDFPWVRQNAWDNAVPTADAGTGQSMHPRDLVTLDGSASSDPEEDYPLTYSWQFSSQPSASTAELSAADTVSPSFTVDALGDYIIELIVTDSLGAQSVADEVVISTYNAVPTADAGTGQSMHPRDLVTLDGSASSDPEEDYPLTYSWQFSSQPSASTAELSAADTVSPSFTVDALGDYIIELIVTDSLGAQSVADEVVISTYNAVPTADAGTDQTIIIIGTTVELDGRQSHDPENDEITYLWTIIQKPAVSTAELSDPSSATPGFTADIHGDYVVSLIVTDEFGAQSSSDSLTVSFENIKPVANAGAEQTVMVGDTVYLDGSASADSNGDLLTYSWSFSSKPEQSLAELADPTLVQTSFTADEPGVYTLSLVVNDGFEDSDAASITITAISHHEMAVRALLDAIDVVNNLDQAVLKNGNVTKDSLINKINVVLDMIGKNSYDTALSKLQNDVIMRTDGCANSNEADSNDWIMTCDGQSQVYPLIINAIGYLQNLI